MLGVGLDLRWKDFKSLKSFKRSAIIGLLFQFALLPAIAYSVTRILQLPISVSLGFILLATCPGGNLSNFFAHASKGNAALSVGMSGISTILSIILTPLNFTFWGNLHPDSASILETIHIDPIETAKTIIWLTIIPSIVGMILAKQTPKLARILRKPIKLFSVSTLVIMLIVTFIQYPSILPYLIPTYPGVIAIAGGGMLFSYLLATKFHINEKDKRSISIEVGVQNTILGIALTFAFFNGLPGMVIVALVWTFWNITTGLLISWWWSKRPTD